MGLAEAASRSGWQVTMIGDHSPQWFNNIELVSWKEWNAESDLYDAFVASRNIAPIDWKLKSKKVVVWTHDIFVMGVKKLPDWALERVDNFVVLSPWHRQFFLEYHEVPEKFHKKVVIVPNGVFTEFFQ
jgi:hypothetical protein